MAEQNPLSERGRSIEEEYFRRKDRELVERLRQAAEAERARSEMSARTGLSDPALLGDLQELGFTPETVALLPLVPVLEVAWAENEITAAERALLVTLARNRGITEGSAADRQLTDWMSRRPAPDVFERARRLITAMLGVGAKPASGGFTADELVAYCEQIAAASGGLLGSRIGSISKEEHQLLSRIVSELTARH
jgi:hypothetical protein